MQAPSIFAYFDYRSFLRDHFAHRKSLNRHYSHRAFARKAGYNSSGLYLLLVNGRQNLTRELIPKFARALGLDAREAEYLEHLADFTHARTAPAKQQAFDRMISLLPQSARNLGREQRDYYARWYHVAVREALSVLDVGEDGKALAAFLQPAIRVSEAKAALKLLAALGLIRKDARGHWKATDASLVSTPELGVVTVRRFQKDMMDLGKAALDSFPREERNIACSTFSLSPGGLERAKLKIDAFQKELAELVRSDSGENRIYQFNVQLFPLSKRKAG